MELHHLKHHAAYVNNYNAAVQQYAEAEKRGSISEMIGLQAAIKFNGGGHLNHSIFWTNLCPPSKYKDPSGDLLNAIERTFGTLKDFQATFSAQAAAVQGSGWGWLVFNKADGNLYIQTLPNQDPVHPNFVPLLGIDVWEHAYYLDYKNVRPDYLRQIWTVVNWDNVSERYKNAVQERNIALSKK
jgi:Fe-Mn family superoxide dismutase